MVLVSAMPGQPPALTVRELKLAISIGGNSLRLKVTAASAPGATSTSASAASNPVLSAISLYEPGTSEENETFPPELVPSAGVIPLAWTSTPSSGLPESSTTEAAIDPGGLSRSIGSPACCDHCANSAQPPDGQGVCGGGATSPSKRKISTRRLASRSTLGPVGSAR